MRPRRRPAAPAARTGRPRRTGRRPSASSLGRRRTRRFCREGRTAVARPRTTRGRAGAATLSATSSRAREVERARAGAELLAALDLEPLAERLLEGVAAVALVRFLPLRREQALHHRVVAVGELDDEPRVERVQPAGELLEREIAPDREVVDEREAQDEVGPAALLEPAALDPAPAAARRRVGEVDDEREDRPRALAAQRRVQLSDDALFAVDRDHVLGVDRAREASVVAAEVPGEPRGTGFAHEPLLAFRVLGLVRRRFAVAGPGRAAPFRLQSPDELLQAPHVRLDQLLAEAGGLEP